MPEKKADRNIFNLGHSKKNIYLILNLQYVKKNTP